LLDANPSQSTESCKNVILIQIIIYALATADTDIPLMNPRNNPADIKAASLEGSLLQVSSSQPSQTRM
jgi:hypothetical protein